MPVEHSLPDHANHGGLLRESALRGLLDLRPRVLRQRLKVYTGFPSSGSGVLVGDVLQLIPVEIDDGKTQVIISPNQLTVFDTKR